MTIVLHFNYTSVRRRIEGLPPQMIALEIPAKLLFEEVAMGWGISPHRYLSNGTAIALVALFSTNALAQEARTVGTTVLDTITIEGKTQNATALSAPQTQTTDRQTIQQRMVTDISDFARRIDAGINFNSDANSINIRGLQNNRVLTTIDGVRLPWLTDPRDSATGGLNAFDFDSLSSVDITKGADSSRFGSGALGGVVELRTLDPEDLIKEGSNFGGIVKSTYNSADDSISGSTAIAGRANDSWLLVQGGYKKGHETDNMGTIGGYGGSRTEPNPMDFSQKNLLVKFHQYLDGGHRLGLTGELFNREDDSHNMRGTTSSYEPGTLMSGEEVDRKRISGSYDFNSPDGTDWVDSANVTVYWQKQRLNNTTDAIRLPDGRSFIIPTDPFLYGLPTGEYFRDNMLEQTTYGVAGSGRKEVHLGGVNHEFKFGGELYWQRIHQFSGGKDNCPDINWTGIPDPFGPQSCRFLHSNASDMPDVNGVTFGAFIEDDIRLLNDRLTVTPGVRFDWYSYDPKSTPEFEQNPNFDPSYLESREDFGISPKLRVAWQATEELELFAQYARGFRAPSALELYQNFGQPGSYARIGNPDLESETSNGFEIGANYVGSEYSVSATIFNNYYRNFIDMVSQPDPGNLYPVNGIVSYENLDRVQIYGIELAGQWQFHPNWHTWGSVAWSHGRNTDTDEYLNSVAPLRAIIGLGYAQETWGTDVSLSLAAKRDKVSGSGFEAPGYGLVDMTAWWAPEKIGDIDVSGLKVQAGIFNVFDKKYWNAVSVPDGTELASRDFYSEPGRTFKISITKKF